MVPTPLSAPCTSNGCGTVPRLRTLTAALDGTVVALVVIDVIDVIDVEAN
jgi:hypothetical protein